MTRSLPLTRISTFWTPSGSRTSKGRRTAWVRLLTKTVPMDMMIPQEKYMAIVYSASAAVSCALYREFDSVTAHALGAPAKGSYAMPDASDWPMAGDAVGSSDGGVQQTTATCKGEGLSYSQCRQLLTEQSIRHRPNQPKSGSYPAASSWFCGSHGGKGLVILATT